MPRRTCPLIVTICWIATVCSGATDPFVGKWKLDASKSTIADQMTIQAAGKDTYTLTFSGSGETETVPADGTDHPGIYGTTVSVTIEKPDSWKIVRKQNGSTVLTAIWTLSGDGKTLRDAFTSYRPDGSTSTLTMAYRRAAGSAGIPGTWVTTDVKIDGVHELEIQPYDGDGLSFLASGSTSPKNVKFDGKEHRDPSDKSGDAASQGRRTGQADLEFTNKINGKVLETRHLTLAPDRKSLTIVVHRAGQRAPNTLVFDRE